ncbi:Deoxyuridine 5'-triphosphate nucleotidohydrolase, mitochondrial [Hypsibius exemplaris]|uniref:Deoxyuridine 5'-triphosphate nucleotidohydrolase n=1 Tax=Hypsibius exemplaris TaxID=2072580 RepID=A0A1W0WIB0_HYPEX|nr:Deoxyuridine 5'-triphosphate nucleotidohydrolase, mitochondrial [Hypsibius exemplaris]
MASNGTGKVLLRFKKLSDKAFSPSKGSQLAAGFDLRSAYEYEIAPQDKCVVLTDLQIAVPEGCYGRVAPRSGLAVKHFIDVGAGVVDADYRGNVGVVLFNFGKEPFKVSPGDRIAQLICEKVAMAELEEAKENLDETTRGAGGFGSTGSHCLILPFLRPSLSAMMAMIPIPPRMTLQSGSFSFSSSSSSSSQAAAPPKRSSSVSCSNLKDSTKGKGGGGRNRSVSAPPAKTSGVGGYGLTASCPTLAPSIRNLHNAGLPTIKEEDNEALAEDDDEAENLDVGAQTRGEVQFGKAWRRFPKLKSDYDHVDGGYHTFRGVADCDGRHSIPRNDSYSMNQPESGGEDGKHSWNCFPFGKTKKRIGNFIRSANQPQPAKAPKLHKNPVL